MTKPHNVRKRRDKRRYARTPEARARRSRRRRDRIKQKISDAKNKPCMDCGKKKDPEVMTFDHVRGEKKFNLSDREATRSWRKTKEEIEKCDIVCRHCHDEREISRGVMNRKKTDESEDSGD